MTYNQLKFEQEFNPTQTKHIKMLLCDDYVVDLSKYKILETIKINYGIGGHNKDDSTIKFINYPSKLKKVSFHKIYGKLDDLPENLVQIDTYYSHRHNDELIEYSSKRPKTMTYSDEDFMNLPSKLKILYCVKENIYRLDNLPSELEELCCNDNVIYSLNSLPNSLIKLTCSHNYIHKLDNLPLRLKYLVCDHNKIIELDLLPSSLIKLYCSHNNLIKLNDLPHGLKYLECEHNWIINLNSLPNNLKEIYASFNGIKSIDKLPKSLIRANFTSNPLINIPKYKNSFILLNYSLDKEKLSVAEKFIQSTHKFTYGFTHKTYYMAKYTTYALGYGTIGLGYLTTLPLVYTCTYAYNELNYVHNNYQQNKI